MDANSSDAAQKLYEWFQNVARVVDDTLFSIAPEGPHRDAVVLDSLRRNARIVYSAKLQPHTAGLRATLDGETSNLYSPLCFFLVASCRRLHAILGVGHWRTALNNARVLRHQLAKVRSESLQVGLDIGTPATLFKAALDEAIRQAGLTGVPSVFNKENEQIALGLAINWGMRLLLAYAPEAAQPAQPSGRRDLAWLADLVNRTESDVAH
jgi:hypothetical protein